MLSNQVIAERLDPGYYHVHLSHLTLVSSNLSLRNRPDPSEYHIDGDGHDSDDPDGLGVVLGMVSKDDREDDTAKVTTSTSETRDDTWDYISRAAYKSVSRGD